MTNIAEHNSHEESEGNQVQSSRIELLVAWHSISVDDLLGDLHHLAVWEESGRGERRLFSREHKRGHIRFLGFERFKFF